MVLTWEILHMRFILMLKKEMSSDLDIICIVFMGDTREMQFIIEKSIS